jgi:hypothetical protein
MVGRQLMIPQLSNGRIPPWCSLLLSHGETYHPVLGQFFVSSRCIAQISRVGLHLPRALQCKMAREHPAQLQPLASNCIQPLARLNFHLKVVWSELPSACVYCVPSYFSFWSQLFSIECFFLGESQPSRSFGSGLKARTFDGRVAQQIPSPSVPFSWDRWQNEANIGALATDHEWTWGWSG